MSSSSAARVLDQLAAPEATSPDVGVSVATVPRSERIAPDVTAIGGAEAVAIVRAGGFIAAIESVSSELAEGMVVEQEPLAGERLVREGVITLRLATPPLDSVLLATEAEAGVASEQAARTAGPDDTEEWFRALAPTRPDASAGTTSGKRHRKHRRPTAPARERFFDPPPAPSAGRSESPRTVTFFQRARERARAWPPLASSVCALAPSLAGLQWRRASALLAGVLLLALLGTRLLASSDRRAQSTHPRALGRTTDAYAPVGKPVSARRPFPRRRTRPSHEPRAGRSRTRNGARARKRNAAPVALVAARPTHQTEASAPSATASAPSAGGQFAYLGQ
jgi:PASTA domain